MMQDMARRGSLAPLFSPRSIAVVGASDDPSKVGYALMASLATFSGAVHPVNRRAGSIMGRSASPVVSAIPDAVDLALVAVPPEAVPDVLDDCGAGGVRAAVIYAGGFAETGDDRRRELQERTADVARSHGIRVLGPNTAGFVNCVDSVNATFLPDVGALAPGPLSIVAQSGGVNFVLSYLATNEGLGLRLGVGLGNAIDVGLADVLDHLAADAETGVIAVHIEGCADGRSVIDAVRRAAAVKPVVAFKIGRSDVGAFGASHTGAMIGSHALACAALAQAGAVVVDGPSELVDAARALAAVPTLPSASAGVGLVTGQAGPGLVVADMLRHRGVSLPLLADATRAHLGRLLAPITFQENPVDTARPGPTFPEVVAAVGADPGIDLVACFALAEPDAIDPTVAVHDAVSSGVPVLMGTTGPVEVVAGSRARLAEVGVPLFDAPDRLAHGVRAVVERARSWHRCATAVEWDPPHHDGPIEAPLDEDEAKQLLASLGVRTPRRRVCEGLDECLAALADLGAPVVAKVLDPAITHKTDVGGVQVGLLDEAMVTAALQGFADAGLDRDRVLIEEQVGPGPELIVGAIRDESFGPSVMLGLGGTFAELAPPVAMRLAPLSVEDVMEMIRALPDGLRHGPRAATIDDASLVKVITAVGALIVDHDAIESVEVNPLRATAEGLVALDAVIAVRGR
jgi:acyl-CoA synthetase (NDP forming)